MKEEERRRCRRGGGGGAGEGEEVGGREGGENTSARTLARARGVTEKMGRSSSITDWPSASRRKGDEGGREG